MFKKPGFIYVLSLIILNLAFQICYSENISGNYGENSNLVLCFDPPFEALEIPGRGVLMVHKGHRLIPLIIPTESEFCDNPRNLFDLENDVWDHFTLVPKDHEEFSQLINEAKDVAEKDEQIFSTLNDLLMKNDGAHFEQKTDNNTMHVVDEPIIIPEHVFPLHDNNRPHADMQTNNKNEEISDFEDSLLLDGFEIPKNDEKDGIRMRILMFTEFSRDFLARKGLPLAIKEEEMYNPENFEFFKLNWPSRDKDLVIEDLPYSIWKVFLGSGVLTSQTTTRLSEEERKKLVLESLNNFFNGLERYYLQNMDSELDFRYYQYLSGIGIEKALETIKYYRESEKLQALSGDKSTMSEDSVNVYSEYPELPSSDPSASSITSSSLVVPEKSEESSVSRSFSASNNQFDNSAVIIEDNQDEISQKNVKRDEAQVIEVEPNKQLEIFTMLRIKWFSIFVNDYLGRLGINFTITEESCKKASIFEFFQTEVGVSSSLPKVIWTLFMENGFESRFPNSTTIEEKMEIVHEIWTMFNQIENGVFEGQIITEGYLSKKDLLDVEIREIMRHYWDRNLNDIANKLIHLSRQRTGEKDSSEIEPILEDELIRNKERAKEMGIFNIEKSDYELSKTGKVSSEISDVGSDIESSRSMDFSSRFETSEKSPMSKKNKKKKKKRKNKIKKSKTKKGKKDESIHKDEIEKQSGVLSKAKELLDSLKKKEPETLVNKAPKENSLPEEISSESTLENTEKSSDSPLNWLKFDPSIKNNSEESEFSEKFGISASPSEKMVENSYESKQLGEDSLHSQKDELEESLNHPEVIDHVEPNKNEVLESLSDLSKNSEKSVSVQPSKEESNIDIVPESKVNVNLLDNIPIADEFSNNEDSIQFEKSITSENHLAKEESRGENIEKTKSEIPENNNEKSVEKLIRPDSGYETTSIPEDNNSEYSSVPNYQERSKVDYEPTEEKSNDLTVSAQNSPKEDFEVSEEETKEESLEEKTIGVSDKEKPVKKKFTKKFEDKLSSLFNKTKKFFGFENKSSKEKESENGDQNQDLEVEEEYENLTNMVIYFIQSYAALRYKFVEEGVIDNSFNEINAIVRSSIHFHQGTVEFDNVDMEKGIKNIAAMMGGGSFTALKSVGLTGKDITANLKKYLLKLYSTVRTEKEYEKNKKLNTTNFWLKQHFTQNLIKEGMIPEQLERPSVIENIQNIVAESTDPKFIEVRAETICKKIPSILEKFFDKSLIQEIKPQDLNCLAVVAVNELYGFSLSNSLYLFLFNYKTKYWRFLTPNICISISQILEKE
ncbi:uncharacterized protein cubi_00061 [Cryptosporidium ubiquitum]|uniref:Uncharacterized protein n=1 Tax=Cryptosporidium ubiquitum TaxID=857276 RepID=A0A1J4MNA2_9CRYT|nr:uncharacterized protein cubi_00061 [Cryptosporidium ubiquitum]OII74508.1 hypothetical protein cubi_00061 [Cryptosporidium ubiquitum]